MLPERIGTPRVTKLGHRALSDLSSHPFPDRNSCARFGPCVVCYNVNMWSAHPAYAVTSAYLLSCTLQTLANSHVERPSFTARRTGSGKSDARSNRQGASSCAQL